MARIFPPYLIKWRKKFVVGEIDKYVSQLLPLNRRGGFGADVVDDAVDAEDFIHKTFACLCQHFVGQARPFGGHEIDRCDRAQDDGFGVGALVAHHAHAAHRDESGEGLRAAVEDARLILPYV